MVPTRNCKTVGSPHVSRRALTRPRSALHALTALQSQTTWGDLGGPLIATNTTASASDVIGPDRQRFYRVVLLL